MLLQYNNEQFHPSIKKKVRFSFAKYHVNTFMENSKFARILMLSFKVFFFVRVVTKFNINLD